MARNTKTPSDEATRLAQDLLDTVVEASGIRPYLRRDKAPRIHYSEHGIGWANARGMTLHLTAPGHWTDSVTIRINDLIGSITGDDSTLGGSVETGTASTGSIARLLPMFKAAAAFEDMWRGGIDELRQKVGTLVAPKLGPEVYTLRKKSDGLLLRSLRDEIVLAFQSRLAAECVFGAQPEADLYEIATLPGYMVCDQFSRPMHTRPSSSGAPALFVSEDDAAKAIHQRDKQGVQHGWEPVEHTIIPLTQATPEVTA